MCSHALVGANVFRLPPGSSSWSGKVRASAILGPRPRVPFDGVSERNGNTRPLDQVPLRDLVNCFNKHCGQELRDSHRRQQADKKADPLKRAGWRRTSPVLRFLSRRLNMFDPRLAGGLAHSGQSYTIHQLADSKQIAGLRSACASPQLTSSPRWAPTC
jgi:hypothetical protein